jgi:hypothetical protein
MSRRWLAPLVAIAVALAAPAPAHAVTDYFLRTGRHKPKPIWVSLQVPSTALAWRVFLVDDAGRKRSPAHASAATWRFVEVAGGYAVINGYSNKCLDIRGPSEANGTPVHQWDCHGGPSQVWRLRPKPLGA